METNRHQNLKKFCLAIILDLRHPLPHFGGPSTANPPIPEQWFWVSISPNAPPAQPCNCLLCRYIDDDHAGCWIRWLPSRRCLTSGAVRDPAACRSLPLFIYLHDNDMISSDRRATRDRLITKPNPPRTLVIFQVLCFENGVTTLAPVTHKQCYHRDRS